MAYIQFAQPASGPFISSQSSQPQYAFSSATNLPFTSDGLASSSEPKPAFKAPAHKHAHHLHSIPPREKSTRTLIIDHMLWVHARTRFAQARAELGMTDRTGGSSSPNYSHRERPENFEEEHEASSDGEDVVKLYAREGGQGYPDEEARLHRQDLGLARSLRLRAEGLEKVVTSMLDQPPTIHPMTDDDIITPPASPKLQSTQRPRGSSHPHTLPNGVRLRLALSTVINDLFARQAAHLPFRQQRHRSPSPETVHVPDILQSTLPQALLPLSAVSAVPSSFTQPIPAEASPTKGYAVPTSIIVRQQPLPIPSSRALSLYTAGADPTTTNSPPAFRCPRHLYTGCEICVEAKSTLKSGGGIGREHAVLTTGRYGLESRGGQHSTGGGISGWQEGSGIGSGLARPAAGSVLRRTPTHLGDDQVDHRTSRNTGNTKLSELIPRFVRLSALVATELGREAKEEERDKDEISLPEADWGNDERQTEEEQGQHGGGSSPMSGPVSATSSTQSRMYGYTLQPSREWYMLLAGLLTRAVLEGYLTAGWKGSEAVECLLTVGLGVVDSGDKGSDSGTQSDDESEEPGDEFEEFEPDELPSLTDAARILFPALRARGPLRKDSAEAEYGMEMDARLRKFFDISATTSDLSTHMEHLACQYYAEPVERAATRFCESIAKWRGTPELETYKKRPPRPLQSNNTETPSSSSMAIDSLVHSSPTSPSGNEDAANARRPPIEKYFTHLSVARDDEWNRSRRRRSADEGNARVGDRVYSYSKPPGNP